MCRIAGRFVLPNTENGPACSNKGVVVAAVPLDISVELGGPPRCVGGGTSCVGWASVPEATVHEDCEPPGWEEGVCIASKCCDRSPMLEEPQALTMEFLPDAAFWARVSGPI